jgi:diacylglycerol kinase family enzyme
MKVSPTSNPTDGVLNLTIQREKFCGYLLGMASVYNGNHVKWKSTTRMAAPLFEVRATNPTETKKIGFEVDGELGGSLPVLIGVSGALMFAAP